MRILHASPQFPYFGGRTIIGGYSSVLLELVLTQGLAGDDVTIISHMPNELGRGEIEPNVRTVELFDKAKPGSVMYGIRFMQTSARWARDNRSEFDVVHMHSGFADYFLSSNHIRTKSGLPTIHTLYCPIPSRGGRWNLPLIRGLLCRSARRIDGLVAMSRNVARSMERWGLDNVHVIPPGVDLNRFAPSDADSIRGSLGFSADNIVFLFVGNAKPQKNLERLIDAFVDVHHNCNEARLVVTTELPRSSSSLQIQAVRQKIDTLGLQPFVVQLGIIDNMPDLIRSADVVITPFLDSFGPSDYFIAALEAMACGVPVISSNVGGMPEIIESPRGSLVDPLDVEAISQAMLAYAENPEYRKSGGEDARRFARATFDPSLAADAYRTMYTEVLG
jgi:glycosyltransferase involved in cell wall biosynthesis